MNCKNQNEDWKQTSFFEKIKQNIHIKKISKIIVNNYFHICNQEGFTDPKEDKNGKNKTTSKKVKSILN